MFSPRCVFNWKSIEDFTSFNIILPSPFGGSLEPKHYSDDFLIHLIILFELPCFSIFLYVVEFISIMYSVSSSSGRVNTAICMHYLDANKTAGEEAWRQWHKNFAGNIEQDLAATPYKA